MKMHRNRRMAAVHCLDTKGVSFLSTSSNLVQRYGLQVTWNCGGEPTIIPTSPMQMEYSKYMHGVDTQDQLHRSYSTQIFTKKWWQRLYFFLLDIALTNSFIMHKNLCSSLGHKTVDHKIFQLEVAHALMAS